MKSHEGAPSTEQERRPIMSGYGYMTPNKNGYHAAHRSNHSTSSTDTVPSLLGERLIATEGEEGRHSSTVNSIDYDKVRPQFSCGRVPVMRVAAFGVLAICAVAVIHSIGSTPHSSDAKGTDIHMSCVDSPNAAASAVSAALSFLNPFRTMYLVTCPLSGAASVPYTFIERKTYNDAAENIVNRDLFHPSLRAEDSESAFLEVPFPTGATWTNLVLEPTPNKGYSYPAVVYPYAYSWNPHGSLQVGYPALHRLTDEFSIRNIVEPDITLETKESVVRRHITAFDPLSVTLKFYASREEENDKTWETYLVQGSPYATVKYNGMTPFFQPLTIFSSFECPPAYNPSAGTSRRARHRRLDTTLANGVCGKGEKEHSLEGVQFVARTEENLVWMLFASKPITLVYNNVSKKSITSMEPFTGVIRVALLPPSPTETLYHPPDGRPAVHAVVDLSSSKAARRLVYHSGTYPTGARLSWDFESSETNSLKSSNASPRTENDLASLNFHFQTEAMTTVDTPLLMLALPHHVDVMDTSASRLDDDDFDTVYKCIKGNMTPITGNSWLLKEKLLATEFDRENAMKNLAKAKGVFPTIVEQVGLDLNHVLPTLRADVYGFGKPCARLAQLAHILHTLSETLGKHNEHIEELIKTSTELLYQYLSGYWNGDGTDYLVFDSNFGGMVSIEGIKDSDTDFGNGRYNDHHFHYGYLLYASAIMGRLNSTFVDEFGDKVDAVMYDIAYRSNTNSLGLVPLSDTEKGYFYFPFARHKSWFDGHSFASGLFPYSNGKSQESSSEAINGYYGAFLWSLLRNGNGNERDAQDWVDFTRLLLAMEIRGSQKYWHMTPPATDGNSTSSAAPPYGDVYDAEFASHYMVGVVGMTDASRTTWFGGTNNLYVHLINFIPITGISSIVFNPEYVKGQFKAAIEPIYPANIEMAWRGYAVCNRAIIEPTEAWKDAQDLASYEMDSSLSKTQVMYFIATMDGFNANEVVEENANSGDEGGDNDGDDGKEEEPDGGSALCEAHPNCSGLSGECCPTPNGAVLACCK